MVRSTGRALDSGPTYDLTHSNDDYFSPLRQGVLAERLRYRLSELPLRWSQAATTG